MPTSAMPTSAVLDDLIDALEEQSDSLFSFLDRHTGEVVLISEESLALTEADPETIAMLPGTPINQVDNFCMLHDLNLNKLKLDWTVFQSESNFSKLSPDQQRQIQEYDQELCDGEASVQIPWWNVSERTAASEIGAFFHSHVPKGARCH
jgi:hypothetical protein